MFHGANQPCDACTTIGVPLEKTNYQGYDLLLCTDPKICRVRAERKGIYKKVSA